MPESAFCPSPDTCLPRSATLVWGATRASRQVLHTVRRFGPCGATAPFGEQDPTSRRPRERCEIAGCVDLFMDVWIAAHTAMHARFPDVRGELPAGASAYLAASARSQVSELNRRARAARGGVAKPQRRDGTVGRIAAACQDPWLADVFRFLLGYAAAPSGAGGDWPLDALTCRKNMWDGGGRVPGARQAHAELRADVEACLAVARAVAGPEWVYDCILLPLANRPGVPVGPPDTDLPCPHARGDDALVEDAAAMLRDMARRTAAGAAAGAALRAAVDAWLDGDPPPAAWTAVCDDDLAVRRLAKRLTAARNRMEEAA